MATGQRGPLGTFTGNVVPVGAVVSDSWLANVDANVNHWIDGTNSMTSLVLDGTGGQTVAPPAGVLQVSGLGMTGTTLPTPTPTLGRLYKDQCIFACITFQHSGTVFSYQNFYNIQSAVRNSAGNYTFTTFLSASQTPLLVQVASSVAGFITVNWTSATTFVVTTANTSNTPTDYNSSVHVTILGR